MNPRMEEVLDALGDPTRRAIVARIARGPATVSALALPLGVTVTAVGQHLRILESAGLAISEKRGRARYCRLRPEGIQAIEEWARHLRNEWEARLDRLGGVLDELDQVSNLSTPSV